MSEQTQLAAIEKVLINGDLSELTPEQRVIYYREVCARLGLDPWSQPFDYLKLSGKLTLYAKRNATDQLRTRKGASTQVVSRERVEDVYVVTSRASTPDGRFDESIGAVPIANLKGEALANALMKAETKSKRRATLALFGLSYLDETELETVPGAEPRVVNVETGEIKAAERPKIEGPKPVETEAPASERMHTPEQRAALERIAPKQAKECNWELLTFDQAAAWIQSEQVRA